MSGALRPQFFCSRPNGTLTPLVAVDELPVNLSLRGIPRVLLPCDTQGMTSLGSVSPRPQTYIVDMAPLTKVPSAHASVSHERDYEMQTSSLPMFAPDEAVSVNQRLDLQALDQPGQTQNWAVQKHSANGWIVPGAGGPSTCGQKAAGSNLKKEYCSYWIRHGECDYQQQGCLFKHEMPTDPAMLEKLGLRDIPRWYREKYRVPSLIPPSHRSHVNGQQWRDDAGVKATQCHSKPGPNGGLLAIEADKVHKQRVSNIHTSVIPDQSRMYATMSAPKGHISHRYAYNKHVHSQVKPNDSKVDLLSFDPLDYSSHNQAIGLAHEMAYPVTTVEQAFSLEAHAQPQAQADRVYREDILRGWNLPSLVPASLPGYNVERSQDPLDTTPCPVRSKRATQPSRRLYQQRAGSGPEASNSFSLKSFRCSIPVVSASTGSNLPAVHTENQNNSSPTIRAGAVASTTNAIGSIESSDPPTGPASPENQSHSPGSSHSGTHANAVPPHGTENEPWHQNQPFPQARAHPAGAIGSKRLQHRGHDVRDDDLFESRTERK